MKLSVIMPVYNTGAEYLRASVQSVLDQSFSDFELIIADDGSDEGCLDCIRDLGDDRIVFIKNDRNLGPSATSNRALDIAKGEYIARMDSDDIAMPERFMKQTELLDSRPDVLVCGSACRRLGSKEIYAFLKSGIPREVIQVRLLTGNITLANPTTMIRGTVFRELGIRYDENIKYSLDYALWVECIKHGNIHVIPEILLDYRVHEGQVSKARRSEQAECVRYTRMKQLDHLGVRLTEEETKEFLKLEGFKEAIDLNRLNALTEKIEEANRKCGIYDRRYLHRECVRWWSAAIRKQRHSGKELMGLPGNKRTWEILSPSCLSYILKYREIYDHNAGC
ncbi:MAG: glycosyltransferase [Lachnospiraceae bacterium]|nr:glycosyltransferase [Lachnospiraceae bacterium]